MIRKTLAKMLPLIVIWIGYSFTKTNASYSISSAGSMPIMTESTLPSDLYDMHHEHGCGSLTNMADCQANAKCTWIQMSDVGRKRPKDGNSELSGQITLLDGTVVDCMDQAMHKYGMTSGTSKQAYFNNDNVHAFFNWSVPFYEPYGEKEWWIGYNYSYYDKPDYTKVFGIPNGMQQSLLSTAFRYNESSTTSTFRYDGKYDLMMQAHSKVAFSEVHTCSADTQAYNGWRNTYTSIERTEGVDVCVPTECKQWLLPNCSPSPTFSDTLYSKTSDEWKSAGFPQNATEGLFCYQYWPWLFWTDRIDSQWTYRDGTTAATFDENRHPWWIGSLGNSSQDAYDYDAELLIDRCDAKITEAECYASVQSSDTCGVSFFNRRFADSGCSSGGRYQCSCMSNSPTAFGAKNTPWISWYNYTNDALDSPNNEDYANSYILDASNDTDMVLTGFGTYKDLNGRYTLSDTLCYNRPVYTRTIESTGETFSLQFFASRANGKLQRQNYTMFHMSIGSNFDDANFLTSNGEYVVTEADISSYNNTPTYTNRQIHKPVDGEVDLGKVSGNIFNGHIGGVEKHRHTYSDMFNGAIYGGPYDLVESQMYTWRLTKGACVSNADSIATDTWALGQCDRFDGGGFNCDVSVRHAYYPSEHNGKWFTYHENSFNASSSCVTTDDPSYKSYLTWLRTYLEPNFLAIKPSPTYDVDDVLYPHHTAPKLVLSAQNGSTYSAQAPVSEVWGLSNVTYDDEIGGVALSYWGVDKEYYFSHYVSMNGFYRVDMNTFNATPPSEVPDDLVEKCALGYDACNSSTLDYWKWYEKDVIMQTLEESKIYSLNRLDVLPGKCYNWPGDKVVDGTDGSILYFYYALDEKDSNAPFFHGSGNYPYSTPKREFVTCSNLNLTSRPRVCDKVGRFGEWCHSENQDETAFHTQFHAGRDQFPSQYPRGCTWGRDEKPFEPWGHFGPTAYPYIIDGPNTYDRIQCQNKTWDDVDPNIHEDYNINGSDCGGCGNTSTWNATNCPYSKCWRWTYAGACSYTGMQDGTSCPTQEYVPIINQSCVVRGPLDFYPESFSLEFDGDGKTPYTKGGIWARDCDTTYEAFSDTSFLCSSPVNKFWEARELCDDWTSETCDGVNSSDDCTPSGLWNKYVYGDATGWYNWRSLTSRYVGVTYENNGYCDLLGHPQTDLNTPCHKPADNRSPNVCNISPLHPYTHNTDALYSSSLFNGERYGEWYAPVMFYGSPLIDNVFQHFGLKNASKAYLRPDRSQFGDWELEYAGCTDPYVTGINSTNYSSWFDDVLVPIVNNSTKCNPDPEVCAFTHDETEGDFYGFYGWGGEDSFTTNYQEPDWLRKSAVFCFNEDDDAAAGSENDVDANAACGWDTSADSNYRMVVKKYSDLSDCAASNEALGNPCKYVDAETGSEAFCGKGSWYDGSSCNRYYCDVEMTNVSGGLDTCFNASSLDDSDDFYFLASGSSVACSSLVCDPNFTLQPYWDSNSSTDLSCSKGVFQGPTCNCSSSNVANSDMSSANAVNGSYGDVVTVTCDVGYEGGGDVTCQADGTFTVVTCTEKTNVCTSTSVDNSDKDADDAVNGSIGDVVFVTCDEGYAGGGNTTCHSNGIFDEVLCILTDSCKNETYDTKIAVDRFDFLRSDSSSNYYYLDAAFQTQSAENTISKSASFLNSYGKTTNLKLTLDDTDHSGFGAVSTGSFEGNDYGDPGSISFVIRTDRVFEDAPDVYYALQIRDTSGRRFVDCSSSWTLTYHYEDSEANVQNGTIACSALAAIKTGSFAVTTFSSDDVMTARVHFELTDGSSQTITSNEETLDVQQKATYDSRDVSGIAGNFWVSAVMDKHFVWPNQGVTIAFYGYSDVNTEYLQFNIEWDSAVLSLDSTMSACHTSACILSGSHFDEIILATNYNSALLPSNKRAITCKDPSDVSSFSNKKVCYVKFTVGSYVTAGGYTNLFSIDSSTVEFTAESSNAWPVLASACTVDDYLGTSSSGRYLINSVQEKGMFSYIYSLTEDMINTRHLDSSTAVTRSLRHEVYENDATSSTITSGLTVTTSLSNVADVTTTEVSLSSSNYRSDSSLNITTTYGSFESYTIVNVWVPTSVGIGTDTSDTTLKRIYDCNSSYDDVYSWLYLSANATFSNGNPEDADMELGITDRVTFTSDNTTVVQIIDGNIARGVGPGSATISIVTNGDTLPFESAPELVLTVEDTDISVTMRAYAITTGFVITPTSNTLFSDFSSSNLQTGTITGYAEQTDLNAQGKTANIVAYASFDDGETWRSLLEDDTKSQFELTMSSMDTTAVTVSDRKLTVVNGAVKQCGYIVRASMVPTCSADGLIQSKQALVYLQMAEPYQATVYPSSQQSIGYTSDASVISTLYGSELTYDTSIQLWIDTDGDWKDSGNTEDGDDVVVLTFDPVGVLSYTVESSSVKVEVQNASYSGNVEVTFDWTSYCVICPNVTQTITVVKATAFEVKGQLYGLSNAYSTDTLTLETLHYVTGTFRRGQLQSYLTTTEEGPTQISWKTITQEFSGSSPCPGPTGTAGNTILLTCNSAGNLSLNATIGDFSDAFSVFVTDTSTLVDSIAISISNGKLTGQIDDEKSLTSFGTIGVVFDDGVTWDNVHSSSYNNYLPVDAYLNFALYDDYASATMDTVGTITLKGNSIELFNFNVSAKNSSVSKNSGDVLGVNLEIDSSSTADIDIQENGESILQFNNPFTVGDKITLEVSLRNSFDYLTISGFNLIFGTEGVVDFPFCATKSAATMCNSCCANSMVVMDYDEYYAESQCGGYPSQRKITTFGDSSDEGIVDVSCAQPITRSTEYTIFTIDVDVIGAGNTTVYATVEYVSDGASTNEQRNEGVTSVAGLGTIVVEGTSRRLQSTEDNRRSSIHGVSTVVERNALHEEEMKKRRGRALLVTTSVGDDYGDVNNDGVYDVNDANRLLQLGQNSITSADIANTNYTDLDYDGQNAILDSLYSSSIVGGVLAFVPEYRSLFQLVSNENDVGELLLSATLLENAAGANAKYASGGEWNVYFQIQLSAFSTFSNASGSCDEDKVRASFADANQWVNGNFSTVFATTDTSSNSITTYVVFGTENSGVFKAQWQYNASEAYCDFDVSYTIAHYRNTCPNSGDCGKTFGTSTFGIFNNTGLGYNVFKMTENEIVHHWNVTCSDTQVAHSDRNETDSIEGSYGDVVTVACNDGYEGGGDVTCESGGSFTTVTCSPINCTSTSVHNSDKSSANAVNGSYGDVVTVTCDVGYEGDGSVLCESTGDWNDTLTCSNVSCADTEVANSDHSTTGSVSGLYEAVVTVTCDVGYEGGGSVLCESTGDWNDTLTCSNVSCADTEVANSDHSTTGSVSGLYEAVVAVTCDAGYEGGGSVLCGSTGDWNDTLACSLTETTTAASSSSSSMIVGLSIGIGGFVFVTALVVVCFLRHRVKHNRRGTKQSSHSSMFQSITNPRILAEKAFDHNAVHTDIRETRPMQDRRVESETGIVLDDQIDGRYGRRNGQYTHTAYPLAVASPDLFATSTTPGSHRSVSPEMRDDETDPALDENGVFQL